MPPPHMAVSGLLLRSTKDDRLGGGGGGGGYLKGNTYKLILNLNHSDGANPNMPKYDNFHAAP